MKDNSNVGKDREGEVIEKLIIVEGKQRGEDESSRKRRQRRL